MNKLMYRRIQLKHTGEGSRKEFLPYHWKMS